MIIVIIVCEFAHAQCVSVCVCYYSDSTRHTLISQMALRVLGRAVHVSDFPRIKYKVSVFVQIRYNLTFIPGSEQPSRVNRHINSVHLSLCLSLTLPPALSNISCFHNYRCNVQFQPPIWGIKRG